MLGKTVSQSRVVGMGYQIQMVANGTIGNQRTLNVSRQPMVPLVGPLVQIVPLVGPIVPLVSLSQQ